MVLLPIAVGAWLNRQFPRQVARASPFAPLMAVTMTVLICSSILATNAAAVRTAGPRLLAAVAALHAGGCIRLSLSACRLTSAEAAEITADQARPHCDSVFTSR